MYRKFCCSLLCCFRNCTLQKHLFWYQTAHSASIFFSIGAAWSKEIIRPSVKACQLLQGIETESYLMRLAKITQQTIQVSNEPLLVKLLQNGLSLIFNKNEMSSSGSIKFFVTCLLENHRFLYIVKRNLYSVSISYKLEEILFFMKAYKLEEILFFMKATASQQQTWLISR